MIYLSNAQIIGKRKKQEDYFASREFNKGYICVVADGMGGTSGGEHASKISVKAFLNYLEENKNIKNFKKLFLNALNYANESIKNYIKDNPNCNEMGTTFVAFYVSEEDFFWISVGDSVLYMYRDGKLKRLNKEHLKVGEINKKLLNGEINQETYDYYPDKHIITSALTGEEIVYIDLPSKKLKIKNDDLFIVASDGLHALSIEDLIFTCKQINDENLANTIVKKIHKVDKKHQDNATLITAKVTLEQKEKEKSFFDKFAHLLSEKLNLKMVNK